MSYLQAASGSIRFFWIWDEGEAQPYNEWRSFRRSFQWESGLVQIALSAAARYRLLVNGSWVVGNGVLRTYNAWKVATAPEYAQNAPLRISM